MTVTDQAVTFAFPAPAGLGTFVLQFDTGIVRIFLASLDNQPLIPVLGLEIGEIQDIWYDDTASTGIYHVILSSGGVYEKVRTFLSEQLRRNITEIQRLALGVNVPVRSILFSSPRFGADRGPNLHPRRPRR